MKKGKKLYIVTAAFGLLLLISAFGAARAGGRSLFNALPWALAPADAAKTARQPISVVQGADVTGLYEGYLWEQCLEEGTDDYVISAHCVPIEDFFPEAAAKIPVFTWDIPLSLQVPAGLSPFKISVYNDAFELTEELHLSQEHPETDEAFAGLCGSLSSGTYYIIISASWQGQYLESAGIYESYGYEYALRLEVP